MNIKQIRLSICITLLCLCGCNDQESKYHIDETTPIQEDEIVSMAFTGDLLFEQGLYDAWDNYQFGSYFDQVKPYLQADIVIGNQEVPIGGEALGVSGVAYTFNAPQQIAEQYPDVGFDIMSVSTNHSYDMGYQGVVNTLRYLHENNIQTFGLYEHETDTDTICIMEKNGIKIALLAYTYDTNVAIDPQYEYVVKTFLNEYREFDEIHQEMLRQDVTKAKQMADVVIVAMHWGNEFTYAINDTQIAATNFLNELGVDLIIGNHPHTLQTMEEVINEQNGNRTIVFYSLGNFVSSAAMVDRASVDFANMYEVGAIVNLDLIKDKTTKQVTIEHIVITPIINHFEHEYTNFALIPFKDYTDELANKHYQSEFSNNFNRTWIKEQIHYLFEGKVTINE